MFSNGERVSLKNTQKYLFNSTHVDDNFTISVNLPPSYNNGDKNYPVLYLLDANFFMGLFADTTRLLQHSEEIPELIVIGVGYPDDDKHIVLRERDYLPTYHESSPTSGKAEQFLKFLNEELKPHIENTYRIKENDSTLVGDSYGGLFALYTLFDKPESFQRYIIGSPTVYWDNRIILDYEKKHFDQKKALNANVFLSVGELEDIENHVFERMVGDVKDLGEMLNNRCYSGLDVTTHIFEGENHCSVIPATMSRGLRDVFNTK